MRYHNTAERILAKHHSTPLQSQHAEEGEGAAHNKCQQYKHFNYVCTDLLEVKTNKNILIK